MQAVQPELLGLIFSDVQTHSENRKKRKVHLLLLSDREHDPASSNKGKTIGFSDSVQAEYENVSSLYL